MAPVIMGNDDRPELGEELTVELLPHRSRDRPAVRPGDVPQRRPRRPAARDGADARHAVQPTTRSPRRWSAATWPTTSRPALSCSSTPPATAPTSVPPTRPRAGPGLASRRKFCDPTRRDALPPRRLRPPLDGARRQMHRVNDTFLAGRAGRRTTWSVGARSTRCSQPAAGSTTRPTSRRSSASRARSGRWRSRWSAPPSNGSRCWSTLSSSVLGRTRPRSSTWLSSGCSNGGSTSASCGASATGPSSPRSAPGRWPRRCSRP